MISILQSPSIRTILFIICLILFFIGITQQVLKNIQVRTNLKNERELYHNITQMHLPYNLTLKNLLFYNLGILSIAFLLSTLADFSTTFNIFTGILIIQIIIICYGSFNKSDSVNIEEDMVDFLTDMSRVYSVYPDIQRSFSEATKYIANNEVKNLFLDISNKSKYSNLIEVMNKTSQEQNISYLKYMANTFELQQSMGGDLSNMLNKMSSSLARQQIAKKEIDTLLLQNTISGVIASAMFPTILIIMFIFTPSYIETFYIDSTGRLILLLSIFWWLLGTAFTIKITKFND